MASRFFKKVHKSDLCWEWLGAKDSAGYGFFRLDGLTQRAHRVSWFIEHNKKPYGILRHICDNPSCVNPHHLLDGTQKDNVQDMLRRKRNANQKKTHCPHGHEYSGQNLYITLKGHRRCKECNKINSRNIRQTKE